MINQIEVAQAASVRICNGDAIFYIGAGFSMVAGMPGWAQLLDELIDELEASSRRKKSDNRQPSILSIAEAAREARKAGSFQYAASLISLGLEYSNVQNTVRKRFSRKKNYPKEVELRIQNRLQSVMNAPLAGIITTNYDNIIESYPEFQDRFSMVALDSVDLPSLFHGRDLDKRFFLKIHGDLNGQVVLSSEDYDRVYLSSPKVQYFMRSCMMQNPIVFLGCSVEDAVLRQRRRLFELYGSGLPPCFQVTARTPHAEVRAHWLMQYANIETLFYEASDRTHIEFDSFLSELVSNMKKENLAKHGLRPSRLIRNTLKNKGKLTRQKLGNINYQIIESVRDHQNSQCSYLGLLESVSKSLPGVDLETIFYRVAFLVSIGALRESDDEEIIISIGHA